MTEEKTTTKGADQGTPSGAEPAATPFGRCVLELMRGRNIADASELGLERLDLRALRRHFDGEKAYHRRYMPRNVAAALEASDDEMTKMALAYIGQECQGVAAQAAYLLRNP